VEVFVEVELSNITSSKSTIVSGGLGSAETKDD